MNNQIWYSSSSFCRIGRNSIDNIQDGWGDLEGGQPLPYSRASSWSEWSPPRAKTKSWPQAKRANGTDDSAWTGITEIWSDLWKRFYVFVWVLVRISIYIYTFCFTIKYVYFLTLPLCFQLFRCIRFLAPSTSSPFLLFRPTSLSSFAGFHGTDPNFIQLWN